MEQLPVLLVGRTGSGACQCWVGRDFVSASSGVEILGSKSLATGSLVPALAKNARTGHPQCGSVSEIKCPGHPSISPQGQLGEPCGGCAGSRFEEVRDKRQRLSGQPKRAIADCVNNRLQSRLRPGVGICHEEKCLESSDRSGFYHLLVLFQPLDGRVRTLRHGAEEGCSVGHRRRFHLCQFRNCHDRRAHRLWPF